jgi:hypothetical protein
LSSAIYICLLFFITCYQSPVLYLMFFISYYQSPLLCSLSPLFPISLFLSPMALFLKSSIPTSHLVCLRPFISCLLSLFCFVPFAFAVLFILRP